MEKIWQDVEVIYTEITNGYLQSNGLIISSFDDRYIICKNNIQIVIKKQFNISKLWISCDDSEFYQISSKVGDKFINSQEESINILNDIIRPYLRQSKLDSMGINL